MQKQAHYRVCIEAHRRTPFGEPKEPAVPIMVIPGGGFSTP
jgi:hypothetical protein